MEISDFVPIHVNMLLSPNDGGGWVTPSVIFIIYLVIIVFSLFE